MESKMIIIFTIVFSVSQISVGYGRWNQPKYLKQGVSCPENGQFPHPTYCGKFLNCWDKEFVVVDCPPGLHFNKEINGCDYPRNVNCGGESESPSAPDNSIGSGSGSGSGGTPGQQPPTEEETHPVIVAPSSPSPAEEEETEETGETTVAPDEGSWTDVFYPILPEWPSFKCPIPNGYLPVVGDCNSLVACINGIGSLLRCQNGQRFDYKQGLCIPDDKKNICQESLKKNNIAAQLNPHVKYMFYPFSLYYPTPLTTSNVGGQKVGKVTGHSVVGFPVSGQMGGQTVVGQMGGKSVVGQIVGYPVVGQMAGHSVVGQMAGHSVVGQMSNNNLVGQMAVAFPEYPSFPYYYKK